MKITLLELDTIKGTLGINPEGLKLNVEWGNNKVYEIMKKMPNDKICGSIWEGKIRYNDFGEKIFNITEFIHDSY